MHSNTPPREHHLIVERTARYVTLGPEPAEARELWIVLHGYGQTADEFIEWFRPIADEERLIVAPEGLSRFYTRGGSDRPGASWMTRLDRLNEIRDYVDYLDDLLEHLVEQMGEEPPLTTLGFSQGGATAARWSLYGERTPSRLILAGSTLPPDLDLTDLRDDLRASELLFLQGTSDRYATPERLEGERRRMEEASLPYRWITFEGGHEIPPDVLAELVAA